MLSYAEHGRSRAIVQERTSPTFSPPAKRYGSGRSSFWLRPLRLRLPQRPAAAVDHGLCTSARTRALTLCAAPIIGVHAAADVGTKAKALA